MCRNCGCPRTHEQATAHSNVGLLPETACYIFSYPLDDYACVNNTWPRGGRPTLRLSQGTIVAFRWRLLGFLVLMSELHVKTTNDMQSKPARLQYSTCFYSRFFLFRQSGRETRTVLELLFSHGIGMMTLLTQHVAGRNSMIGNRSEYHSGEIEPSKLNTINTTTDSQYSSSRCLRYEYSLSYAVRTVVYIIQYNTTVVVF